MLATRSIQQQTVCTKCTAICSTRYHTAHITPVAATVTYKPLTQLPYTFQLSIDDSSILCPSSTYRHYCQHSAVLIQFLYLLFQSPNLLYSCSNTTVAVIQYVNCYCQTNLHLTVICINSISFTISAQPQFACCFNCGYCAVDLGQCHHHEPFRAQSPLRRRS